MPQFRNSDKEAQTSQLLTYPVLMAHDLEGYAKVFVGEDQIPHIDLARKLINRYARVHNKTAVCPEPVITTVKIADLKKSDRKMSKTFEQGCLFLDDSPEQMRSKIRKAVMDEVGTQNLRVLYDEFVGEDMPCSNGIAKDRLSDKMIERFH